MKCYVEYGVIIIDISTIYNKEILKIQNTRYNMEFQILVQVLTWRLRSHTYHVFEHAVDTVTSRFHC